MNKTEKLLGKTKEQYEEMVNITSWYLVGLSIVILLAVILTYVSIGGI